jgi:hypothetical protein
LISQSRGLGDVYKRQDMPRLGRAEKIDKLAKAYGIEPI